MKDNYDEVYQELISENAPDTVELTMQECDNILKQAFTDPRQMQAFMKQIQQAISVAISQQVLALQHEITGIKSQITGIKARLDNIEVRLDRNNIN